jgi:hypothetical protein
VVGIVAGWLAGQVVRGGGFGLISDLIVGVIGAFILETTGMVFIPQNGGGPGLGFWRRRKRPMNEGTGDRRIREIARLQA